MPERIGNIHKENASTVFLNYRSKSCECLQPLFKLTLIIFYNEIIIMSDACLNATRLQQNFCPRMRERCSRRGLRRMLLTLYFEDAPYSLFRGYSLLSISRMLLTLYFEDAPYSLFRGCSLLSISRMLLTLYFEDAPYSLFRGCSLLSISKAEMYCTAINAHPSCALGLKNSGLTFYCSSRFFQLKIMTFCKV